MRIGGGGGEPGGGGGLLFLRGLDSHGNFLDFFDPFCRRTLYIKV